MKILIPTCKARKDTEAQLNEILHNYRNGVCAVRRSCDKEANAFSAAQNRNWCLGQINLGEIAIMLDDDIEGFYPGWIADLTKPLEDESVVMVSARLMNPDGTVGLTCSRCYDLEPDEIEIFTNGVCVLPTAAIAFRHRGHMFDENFIGSGFEDNDWCMQYLQADPCARFIQSNRCKLIHRNEMKNQKGKFWQKNQHYFYSKWRPSFVNVMS